MKVLVIRGTMMQVNASTSCKLTNKFLDLYKQKNPNAEIIEMDLNKEEAGMHSMTSDNMKEFFLTSDKYIDLLKSVDKVIMSCPMTNFNYPAVVKNFIDHICVADKTFSYKYSKNGGSVGLLTNLKVQILTTQGAPMGWYPFGNHTETLKGTWEFLGAQVNPTFVLAGTKVKPAIDMTSEEYINTFSDELKKLAESL